MQISGWLLRIKTQIDRLCMLALEDAAAMDVFLADHQQILAELNIGDLDLLDSIIGMHLARLDSTIQKIQASHTKIFEG